MNQRTNNTVKTLCITAMFITIAVVLRFLGVMVPIGGIGGMRISFAGFFSKLPAILFGPIYGGATSGVTDILGYILKPEGAYLPLLTVTAIIGGIIVGLLWKYLKNFKETTFRTVFRIATVLIGIFTIYTLITVNFFETSGYGVFLTSLNKTRYSLFTSGCVVTFILCFIVCITDYVILKKQAALSQNFMRLLFVLLCANLTVTTLNTFILRSFIPALGNLNFMVYYTPRLIEEIIMTIIQCYGMSFLLSLMPKLKLNVE